MKVTNDIFIHDVSRKEFAELGKRHPTGNYNRGDTSEFFKLTIQCEGKETITITWFLDDAENKAMTKREFKERWESDDIDDGITFEEVANCSRDWGIISHPETVKRDVVLYLVLREAEIPDLEEYLPER